MKKFFLLIGISLLFNFSAEASCGSASTQYVPDAPLWFNMEPACEVHDRCYDECGATRSNCDSDFKHRMRKICKNRFKRWDPRRPVCLDVAGLYYTAVRRFGGDAFEDAQIRSCN